MGWHAAPRSVFSALSPLSPPPLRSLDLRGSISSFLRVTSLASVSSVVVLVLVLLVLLDASRVAW